ncbi:MAG: amidohydrolase [Pseudomonadota bacterium]
MKTTVYQAKRIITMDRNCPSATHVAVRDGRVVAVGGPACAEGWGEVVHDDGFQDQVILPGLVEAHAHVSAGSVWRNTYCGHYTRTDPNGRDWPGVKDNDALITRLRERVNETPEGQPIVAWGFDPSFVNGPRLDRSLLDHASTTRPIAVVHSNGHLLTANSVAMNKAGLGRETNIEGVVRDASGDVTGELHEFAAMALVKGVVGMENELSPDADGVRAYGQVARRCGVTTVADLFSNLFDDEVAMLHRVTADPDFPARYVPIMNAMAGEPEFEAQRALALRVQSTSKLLMGRAKLFTDGSIQGGTAMLKPPGYYAMADHAMCNMEEAHFRATVRALHRAGVKTHVHTNGDAASELAIDAFADAIRSAPDADLRHTLEHAQLAGIGQFKRMRSLGLTVNLFANHLYYFGDVHWTRTLGPDRTSRMNACADAWSVWEGDFAIHSDAPVTPMAPLMTAWCAVNRVSEQGRVLGESQQISVAQALHCITLGAAYVLKLDHEVGSIQCGKRADFCIVDSDPFHVDPTALKDIRPVATVLGGQVTH